MKVSNKLLMILLISLFITSSIFAHGYEAHQHLVREAYKLLQIQLNMNIPIMHDHVGTNQKGHANFIPGDKIVIGAYREDKSDIVWGYGVPQWPIESTSTVTHFWNPDYGDNSKFDLGILGKYPNAYQKALKYIWRMGVKGVLS